MQTIKAIQRLCAVTPSIAVRCADLSVSSVKYGTTPQQKLAAQSEARKKAVTINKYISLARGAVRSGGDVKDPAINKGLARVIDQSIKEGIPRKTILNAISESTKSFKSESTYLITSPAGMASLINCKAVSLAHGKLMLNRHLNKSMFQGALTESKYLGDYFERKGVVIIESPIIDGKELTEDEQTDLAIEMDAEDVKKTNEGLKFVCPPTTLKTVVDAFQNKGMTVLYSNVDYLPINMFNADQDSRQFYKLFCQLLQQKGTPADRSCDFTELANNFDE